MRRFADEDGNLVVYDRIREVTRPDNIANVAVKTNLYTVYDASGEPSDMIETQWLARIEDAFDEIVPKLQGPHPVLTSEERRLVCLFIALQHMRTVHMRDSLAGIVDTLLRLDIVSRTQGMTPEEADRALDEWNSHASDREKARLRRIVADPSQPVEWDATPWIKAIMRLLPLHTKGLETREWHLIEAQDGAFLASDSPIALGGELLVPSVPRRTWCVQCRLSVLLLEPPGSEPVWRFGRDREYRLGRLVRRKFRRHPLQVEFEHRGFVREVNQLVADVAARESSGTPTRTQWRTLPGASGCIKPP